MSDDQFSPEPDSEKEKPNFLDPDLELEIEFEPISQVELPDGGQYPDDVFGIESDDSAFDQPLKEIEIPIEDYDEPGAGSVAEYSIELPGGVSLPVEHEAEAESPAKGDTEGDMFSIDDLMGGGNSGFESAPPLPAPPPDPDMFSIDDLVDDTAEAAGRISSNELPAGGDMFAVNDLLDGDIAADETSILDEQPALAAPELEPHHPAPLPAPPDDNFSPIEAVESPIEAVSSEFASVPSEATEAIELAATVEVPPVVDGEFVDNQADEAQAIEPDVDIVSAIEPVSPYGIIESQAQTASSAFGFSEIDSEPSTPSFEPVESDPEISQIVETGEPAATQYEPVSEITGDLATYEPQSVDSEQVVYEPIPPELADSISELDSTPEQANPLQPEYSEAGVQPETIEQQPPDLVYDGSESELEFASAELTENVDPGQDELTEPVGSQNAESGYSEPEYVEPEYAEPGYVESEAYDYNGVDAEQVAGDEIYDESASYEAASYDPSTHDDMHGAPAVYGEATVAIDEYGNPLQAESASGRAESIAPPGATSAIPGGVLVAGGGRSKRTASVDSSGASTSSGKGRKRTLRRRRPDSGLEASVAPTASASPETPLDLAAPGVLPVPQQPSVADQPSAMTPAPAIFDQTDEDLARAQSQPIDAILAGGPDPVKGKTFFGIKYGKPATTVAISPTAAAPKAKKANTVKPPKQGKSFADKVLGTAKPGERHSFFGIKFGQAAPLPGQAVALPPSEVMAPPATTGPVATSSTIDHGVQPSATTGQVVQSPLLAGPPEPDQQVARYADVPEVTNVVEASSAKPPRQGKSFADKVFGMAKPGERHSFFGIKFGQAAPLPGQAVALPPSEVMAPPATTGRVAAPSHSDYPASTPDRSMVAPPIAESSVAQPTVVLPEAEIIQSAEAAVHAQKRKSFRRKPKAVAEAAKPKPAKTPKRGKSLADVLFGETKPGERHRFFGIKFGQAAPFLDEASAPPPSVAAPAPIDTEQFIQQQPVVGPQVPGSISGSVMPAPPSQQPQAQAFPQAQNFPQPQAFPPAQQSQAPDFQESPPQSGFSAAPSVFPQASPEASGFPRPAIPPFPSPVEDKDPRQVSGG